MRISKNLQEGYSGIMETQEVRKTIGNFSAFVICINYVVGTGIFSLPFGFYKSGILLSTICLLVSGVFSLLCAYWVLEVLARTEGIQSSVYDIQSSASFTDEKGPVNQVTFRKFDFTKMFETYYGAPGKYLCQLVMSLYCYGVLWAFTAVFAVSVSSLFYEFALHKTCDISLGDQTLDCRIAYYACVLLFSIIVVPLSCIDLGEQAVVQVTLATYRLIAFILMVTTVAIALFHPNPNKLPSTEVPKGPPYLAFDSLFKWDGFSTIFSSSVVALTFHYCIPDLIVTVKDKKSFQKVITGAIVVIISIYLIFGVVISLYFGESTNALVTLNWTTYTGQAGGWGAIEHRPCWAAMIQLLVMIFPILDMLSVFPLVAITLGNNIRESMPRAFKEKFPGKFGKISCRLIAAIPPILMGAGLGELNKIFTFTALFAFFLEFVFPSFLQISSVRMCQKWWGKGSEVTPYSSFLSKFPFVVITLVFATFSFTFDFVAFVKPSFINKIFS